MAVDSTAARDALVTLLAEAGAKNIYTEDPKLIDWDSTIDHLRQEDGQYIQCWVIRRVGATPMTAESHHGQVPTCSVHWMLTFRIMMFFGYVEGSSEDQMQALIDQVLTYMQGQRTLNDTIFGNRAPLGLQSINPAELGGIGGWEAVFTMMGEQHETGVTME